MVSRNIDEVGMEAVIRGVGVYAANAGKVVSSNKAINASLKATAKTAAVFGKAIKTAMKIGAVAVVIGIAASINVFKNFDAAMTESIAIMGDVSDAMRDKMERAARDVALTTTFSMEAAAKSYFFLASAGLNAAQSIGAMPIVARFAQAGMFDMALATDLLTDAQSALGLTVDDTAQNMLNMTKVSDILVKANTLANATVQQFSEALTREAGAALKTLNKDLEEGVAVLAAFADQGIKGQIAGTGLSRIIRLMSAAAIKNADAYKNLNVEVFDSTGKFRNFADIIEDLENALLHLSDEQRAAALEALGFKARVQGIILPLLGTSSAIREYEAALRGAQGITEEIASKQLKSLSAQLSLLRSGFEDVAFTMGKALEPALKGLVTILRVDVVPWIGERLPQAIDKVERAFRDWQPALKESAILLKQIGGAIRTSFQWILDNEFRLVAALFAISVAMIGIWGPVGVIATGVAAAIIVIGLFRADIDELGTSALKMKRKFLEVFLAIAEAAQAMLGPLDKLLGAITGASFANVIRNLTSQTREINQLIAENEFTTRQADLAARAFVVGLTEEEIAAGLAARSIFGLTSNTLESTVAALEMGKTAPSFMQLFRIVQRGAEAAGISMNQFRLIMITTVEEMAKLSEAFVAVVRLSGFSAGLVKVRAFRDEIQRLKDAIAGEGGFIPLPVIPPPLGGFDADGGADADAGADAFADAASEAWERAIRRWTDSIVKGVRAGTITVVDALAEFERDAVGRAAIIVGALLQEELRIATQFEVMADIIARGFARVSDAQKLFAVGAGEAALEVLRTISGETTELADQIDALSVATAAQEDRESRLAEIEQQRRDNLDEILDIEDQLAASRARGDPARAREALVNRLQNLAGINVSIDFEVDALREAIEEFAEALRALTDFQGVPTLPTFAHGGRLRAGEPGIVGEKGAELIVPRQDVSIIPFPSSMSALLANRPAASRSNDNSFRNYGHITINEREDSAMRIVRTLTRSMS